MLSRMVYTYGTRQDMAEKHLLLFLIGPRGLVVIDPGKIFGGNIANRKCFFLALSDGSAEFRFEFIGLGSCSYKRWDDSGHRPYYRRLSAIST